jgi:hypothetical protein
VIDWLRVFFWFCVSALLVRLMWLYFRRPGGDS